MITQTQACPVRREALKEGFDLDAGDGCFYPEDLEDVIKKYNVPNAKPSKYLPAGTLVFYKQDAFDFTKDIGGVSP